MSEIRWNLGLPAFACFLIRSCEDKRADLDSGRVSKRGEVSTDTVLAFEYATTAKVRFGWWLVEFPSILNPPVPLSVYLRISVTVGSLVSTSHGGHGESPCRALDRRDVEPPWYALNRCVRDTFLLGRVRPTPFQTTK